MPDYKYKHLLTMTDEYGILQFSVLDQPDPDSGYTIDDNSRGLIVSLGMNGGEALSVIYVNNLYRAQQTDGNWSNLFLKGQYCSRFNSEDSVGRSLLACSLAASATCAHTSLIGWRILEKQLIKAENFRSPRAISYAILALTKGPACLLRDNKKWGLLNLLCSRLLTFYHQSKSASWYWFEDTVTYCNSVMPHALWSAYKIIPDKKVLICAQDSLQFLNNLQFLPGYLNVIGNGGWYQREKPGLPPLYDQQPVEAASAAFACYEAYTAAGSPQYYQQFKLARQWFHGKNLNSQTLIDKKSGGCYDGLTPVGTNLNQGAESLLSYLLVEQLWAGYHQK
ncbi:MAG: hypothetical protein LBR98_09485 [Syntrophomonadaceae bacterium]|jgi:hypothetical protein|nr:hypothetical protein [Syntrophomonadaceae bacterium]